MQYQNDLFQSINPSRIKKSKYSHHILIGITCAVVATASYAFFAPTTPPAADNLILTLDDITTKIEPAKKSAPAESSIDSSETEPLLPVISATARPTQSVQSLSTIWQEHKIKSGESLSVIFDKNNLSKSDLHEIIHANDIGPQFATIQPGKSLLIGHNISGKLSHLVYKKNDYNQLKATRLEDGSFTVERIIKESIPRIASASGIIHTSLFIDGKNAGLSDRTIMQLTDIFAWDIDLAHSLRDGDQFTVFYEKLYIDDKQIGTGDILAAEFINQGHSIKALCYKDASGKTSYYTPEGDSMRKAFLRTPIDFARISSHFNLRRKHPVLNRIRAHKGVDYAASSGTPIKTTGDGKIIFRGRKGGYGNVVIIQHGQRYSTLYAHMSKFQKGLNTGSHVYQGQVIGYVGRTGLASGAHLHYEFRVNGIHRNPLKVKLPNANPIQEKYKADFLEKTKILISQLEQLSATHVAASAQ